MKQYDTFVIDSYTFDVDKGLVSLHYSLDDELKFTETLTLPTNVQRRPEIMGQDRAAFHAALGALHIIGGISYYKTCLPKNINVRNAKLSALQALFWNKVYENGLGEFFYRNNIDFRKLIHFPVDHPDQPSSPPSDVRSPKSDVRTRKRILVPIGGGKDSMVTVELLRAAGHDITLFRMGSHPILDELARVADLPMITVERQLSPALFKLNEQGALNGHIPITAYLSCLTVVLAILYGFDAVVLSNERSANEGNVRYLGREINHQWSKSLEFERMFQDYLHRFISPDIDSFSLVRPLSELHIAKLFTDYPQYFAQVTSCNKNWKILKDEMARHERGPKGRVEWCGTCPKCAFVFALLAGFLPKDQLMTMFQKNLFEDESLKPLYRELLGLEGSKPFECVGTPNETVSAFILAQERGEFTDTPIMQMALDEVRLPEDVHGLIEQELTPSEDHAIPKAYIPAAS